MEHDNGQVKMLKILFYRGTWQREYDKEYYGNELIIFFMIYIFCLYNSLKWMMVLLVSKYITNPDVYIFYQIKINSWLAKNNNFEYKR